MLYSWGSARPCHPAFISGICTYKCSDMKWWEILIILQPPTAIFIMSQIARFMGPTWGPSGAGRTQVGPMLAPWTLLSGVIIKWTVEENRKYISSATKAIYLNEHTRVGHQRPTQANRPHIFFYLLLSWLKTKERQPIVVASDNTIDGRQNTELTTRTIHLTVAKLSKR